MRKNIIIQNFLRLFIDSYYSKISITLKSELDKQIIIEKISTKYETVFIWIINFVSQGKSYFIINTIKRNMYEKYIKTKGRSYSDTYRILETCSNLNFDGESEKPTKVFHLWCLKKHKTTATFPGIIKKM